jgi:hypothetical protein
MAPSIFPVSSSTIARNSWPQPSSAGQMICRPEATRSGALGCVVARRCVPYVIRANPEAGCLAARAATLDVGISYTEQPPHPSTHKKSMT